MSITGGDWRVAGTTQSRYIDALQPDGMVQEVAWCGQCEYGDNIDNARLLCAAPDLLEALENLALQVKRHADFQGHTEGWMAFDDAMQAISKATGK